MMLAVFFPAAPLGATEGAAGDEVAVGGATGGEAPPEPSQLQGITSSVKKPLGSPATESDPL